MLSIFYCHIKRLYFVKGSDIIGLAETGSGKTGAFALPILQALLGKTYIFIYVHALFLLIFVICYGKKKKIFRI